MLGTLLLDLGDVFTKGLAIGPLGRRRLRFPSVVARRLLTRAPEPAELLLEGQPELLRPTDFDPSDYRRTRSYPGAAAFLENFRVQAETRGARYAGWQAATYGADRQVLGTDPGRDNLDALLHKALILARPMLEREVEIVFLVDSGPKAHAIQRYAEQLPPRVTFDVRSVRDRTPRRVELALAARLLDAAACAARVLPGEFSAEAVLLADIGYFRTKLSVIAREGCQHQEQLDGWGVGTCVQRILRDEQEHGLVEDEFAVMRALERSVGGRLRVADREFDVTHSLGRAGDALALELGQAARRVALHYYGRRGDACRRVAIIGGGAAVVGPKLAANLARAGCGLENHWTTPDTGFLLLQGAELALQPRAT